MDREYYDRYWSGESAAPDNDPTTPARKRRLETALSGLEKGSAVLDLGCGRGEFTAFIKELGFVAYGTDLSHKTIADCNSRYPGVLFSPTTSGGALPFSDEKFAAIWSSEVIEHVFDIHAWLSEANRVLLPDGLLILTTPYHGILKNFLIVLTKFDKHFDPEISHIRFFDQRGLERCMKRAGFMPHTWGGIGRCWPLYRTWFAVFKKTGRPKAPPEIKG